MKKNLLSALLLTASLSSQANSVNLDFGMDRWFNSASGTLQMVDTLTIDDDDSSSSIWVNIEHPIPFLPNLRVNQNIMDYQVAENATNNTTDMDLSHADVIAYYQVLDNAFELDIGGGFKRFFGEIKTTAIGGVDAVGLYEVENNLAILYAMAGTEILTTNMHVNLTLQQAFNGDDSVNEASLMLSYNSEKGIGIGAGYRYMTVELENESNGSTAIIDSDFKGLQVSFSFHL